MGKNLANFGKQRMVWMVKMLLLCRGCDEVWKTSQDSKKKRGVTTTVGSTDLPVPRSCGCPIPGGVPGLAGQDLEQRGLVEDLSASGRWWNGISFKAPSTQTIPWLYPVFVSYLQPTGAAAAVSCVDVVPGLWAPSASDSCHAAGELDKEKPQ